MKNYTVYHLHDFTSNCNGYMDSTTDYKKYIKLAKKNNMSAIAFSNHGGIYDWVKKKQLCDKNGIKYIHGFEGYMCTELHNDERGYHIGLYARNLEGVKELNSLLSLSFKKGNREDKKDRQFYYNPRLSMNQIMSTSDNIIITTACLASILWKKKDDKDGYVDKFLNWLSNNNHRCFLEVQYHTHPHQIQYNKMLHKWSNEYNIPLIAGTDTHSADDYDAECRIILQKSKNANYSEDMETEFDLTWKSYDDVLSKFKNQNSLPEDVILEAINNTNVFSDMIEPFDLNYDFKYPDLYGNDGYKLWKDMITKKFNNKLKAGAVDKNRINEYKIRIKEEIVAMKKQGMQDFMLFMAELVDYCNDNNIPYGFCRGSVGGSLIAYITDIIDVDPIVWNTVFSRFCNEDRISLADIDMDFASEDRSKVYEYIINRFTSVRTAYILTLGTLKDRGTIDTLAMGLDYHDLNLVATIKDDFDRIFDEYSKIVQEEVNLEELVEEKILDGSAIDFDNHDIYMFRINVNKKKNKLQKLKDEFEQIKSNNQDLFYYFDGLKNCVVSKGNHPAGMIGSPITLPDNLGVHYKDGDENFPISSCSMKAVDSLNYVKFDILGLKNVGILKDVYKYVGSEYLKSYQIDWNDKNVWRDMIKSQVGIFQFEGDFAFSLLKKFEPQQVNDMSLVNAALRPSGKSYRDRLIDREFNNNPSSEIDELLKDNAGYLVFQEDTIKFLTDICGFSGGLADTTRRAIGKKDEELLKQQLPKILEGYCNYSKKDRDVAEEEAKEFIQIVRDSSEYQFGYNHSTGYSMIGYALARMRYYYPLEFLTAYLNRADKTKHLLLGMELASELNIEVKPIEFGKSHSEYMFDKKENCVYKGIGSIKFCNNKIAEEMFELTKQNKFNNIIEVISDIINNTSTNYRQIKILAGLGFFRRFGKNKYILDVIDRFELLAHRKQINHKQINDFNMSMSLLEKYSGKITPKTFSQIDFKSYLLDEIKYIENKPMSVKDQIKFEMEYLEYAKYHHEKFPSNFYIVTEYKTYKDKRKPYVTLHSLRDGSQLKTKVKNVNIFSENPFAIFNVLKVNEFKTKKKTKNVGGKWIKTDEDEQILHDWEVY